MGMVTDYPGLCRGRSTNPEYVFDVLGAMRKEFQKGMDGHGVDPTYLQKKLDSIQQHIRFLAANCDWPPVETDDPE